MCDCKTGTTGLTCCPGGLAGMMDSSPGFAAAWWSLLPSVPPLQQPPEPQRCILQPPSASTQGPCQPRAPTGFHLLPKIRFPSCSSGATAHACLAPGFPHHGKLTRAPTHLLIIRSCGEQCFTLLLCILATDYKYNSGKSFLN